MTDVAPDTTTERLKALLDEARARLTDTHAHAPGLDVVRVYSEDWDRILQTLAEEMAPQFPGAEKNMVIVATGGFGRRELNLQSDIDLMFLCREEPTETQQAFVKAYLYPLWNLRVDLGYALKTQKEAFAILDEDFDFATSIIGARAIWGDPKLFSDFTEHFRGVARDKHRDAIGRDILKRARIRRSKNSDTIFLLEPNIKEARGGLRDLHVACWLTFLRFGEWHLSTLTAQGLLTPREERALRRSHAFLIQLRNALHLLEGRKTDQLTFERQIKIASQMGFGNDITRKTGAMLPEERLMRAYYDHAQTIDRYLERLVMRLGFGEESTSSTAVNKRLRRSRIEGEFWTRENQIFVLPKDAEKTIRDPAWALRAFHAGAVHGYLFDDFTLDLVERTLPGVDDAFRRSPANRDRFLAILGNVDHGPRILRRMHECRFLETYLPEFALVRNLPRIDYYHQFTVDEHLLRAVECAAELLDPDSPMSSTHVGTVAGEILRWDVLAFALLYHDVGKGEGRGHVMRSAHLVQRAAERLGMKRRPCEVLHDLVMNHHKLSHAALRRNPEDPKVPKEMARDIADPEMMRMLYVLTCCDLRAVSEDSWNDWRASLLSSLYERTMDALLGREDRLHRPMVNTGYLVTRVEEALPLLEDLGKEAEANLDSAEPSPCDDDPSAPRPSVEEFLRALPERYRRFTPPHQVAMHMRMAQKVCEAEPVNWVLEPVEGCNYAMLTCLSLDAPGLFRHICGALASRGYNILSAQIYTSRNGLCVDVFQIQGQDRQPPRDSSALDRLRTRLNQVLRGEREPKWENNPGPLSRPQPISAARLNLHPPSVVFNNEADFESATVLEVRAPDRAGLLYDILSVLDRHRINVHLALIATEAYQIIDVFYITDWENNRIEDNSRPAESLRRDLLMAIAPPATVGEVPIDESLGSEDVTRY
ncbi:MAG: [protein-PII] uridylyltransferase [Sumerlaeia bacterium]